MIFAEIMLASTMNAVFVAFFPLLTLRFRTVPTQRFLLFVANSRFCNGMRRAVYVSRPSPSSVDLAGPMLVELALFPADRSTRHRPPLAARGEHPAFTENLLRAGNRGRAIDGAKYRQPRRKPPSQAWRTFLWNHVGQMGSIDFFTLPTASAVCLRCPVAWTTACGALPGNRTPHPRLDHAADAKGVSLGPSTHLGRDRDAIYGQDFSD